MTGPNYLFISIHFGHEHSEDPRITKLCKPEDEDVGVQFNLDRHVKEILEGVSQANEEFSGNLAVLEVQVIPYDRPQFGQATKISYEIAKSVLTG